MPSAPQYACQSVFLLNANANKPGVLRSVKFCHRPDWHNWGSD